MKILIGILSIILMSACGKTEVSDFNSKLVSDWNLTSTSCNPDTSLLIDKELLSIDSFGNFTDDIHFYNSKNGKLESSSLIGTFTLNANSLNSIRGQYTFTVDSTTLKLTNENNCTETFNRVGIEL